MLEIRLTISITEIWNNLLSNAPYSSPFNMAPYSDAVAIIGMGCRFAGGIKKPEDLWEFTLDGGDAVVPVPRDRWNRDLWYDEDPKVPGKAHVLYGSFLDTKEIAEFDNEFFDISKKEAEKMDPQQRMLLKVTWEAIENAGLTKDQIQNDKTGVFTGCFTNDNMFVLSKEMQETSTTTAFEATQTLLSARVAYALNLSGTCLTVDTACSSSLTAVHLAVKSLLNHEVSLALAGGVNAIHSPEIFAWMSKGVLLPRCEMTMYVFRLVYSNTQLTPVDLSMQHIIGGFLSPDGRCKTFSDSAGGYGRGEGCGVLVLRRLEDAIESNENIIAVIHGSATNHDGRTTGIAAPSRNAQKLVIQDALTQAGSNAADVVYVEAHGTGTVAGDAAEIGAIADTYGKARKETTAQEIDKEPVRVASVKSNIGHTEGAAGIAGLIRVALAVKKKTIPKHTILVGKLNKELEIGPEYGVEVPFTTRHIDKADFRVGVSSYGYGGSNCHIVLGPSFGNGSVSEEVVELDNSVGVLHGSPFLLPMSARSDFALKNFAKKLADYIEKGHENKGITMESLYSTLAFHRSHFEHRAIIKASNLSDTIHGLRCLVESADPEKGITRVIEGECNLQRESKIVFVFTGMGPQVRYSSVFRVRDSWLLDLIKYCFA